jgi:hypothetical protein
MKNKDIGTCLRYKNGIQIFRSKYKNQKDAQDELDKLLYIGVVNTSHIVYKCPECKLWHVGSKEWAK